MVCKFHTPSFVHTLLWTYSHYNINIFTLSISDWNKDRVNLLSVGKGWRTPRYNSCCEDISWQHPSFLIQMFLLIVLKKKSFIQITKSPFLNNTLLRKGFGLHIFCYKSIMLLILTKETKLYKLSLHSPINILFFL